MTPHSDQHTPPRRDDPSQLLERLSALHFHLRSIFDELELTSDSVARRRLAVHLAQQFRSHATLEEAVLFPLVEELGGRAARWVEQARLVHRSIDGLQHELLATDLSAARLRGFRDMVTRCLEDEETWIFPSVEGLDEQMAGELQRRMSACEDASAAASRLE
jgi:hemerythrin superfamily protein